MGRHEQREQVFRLLFQAEFHPAQDMPRQMRLFVEDNEEIGSQKDADYIEKRCQTVFRELPGMEYQADGQGGAGCAAPGGVRAAL